jgi:hypothetical protein
MAKLSSIATTNDDTTKFVSHHIKPAVIVVLISRLIALRAWSELCGPLYYGCICRKPKGVRAIEA